MSDLAGLFAGTLSPDRNTGLQSELQLRKLDGQPGMLPATLQIIDNAQYDVGVRQAAAIYLKNRVQTAWEERDRKDKIQSIPLEDRNIVKQHIIPAMHHSQLAVKLQLRAAVGNIVVEDFPEKWPELLPQIKAALESGQEAQIETALMCLLEAFKKYQYRIMSSDRSVPQGMSAQFLPGLLSLANNLLQATPAPACPENVAKILHLTFKVYRLSISHELTPHHQDLQGSLIPWGSLFLQVASRQLDPAALPQDEDARERCEWWKAKKWAYFCLGRLFSRYGSPSQLQDNMKQYKGFAENFEAHFAPEIFRNFLKQVELYVQNPQAHWLSERVKRHIIDFFDECVKPKSTWNLLRPHLGLLLQHFLFPLICPSPAELIEFEEDPIEYTRAHASEIVVDFFARSDVAVLHLCNTLVSCRKKSALVPLVSFALQIMEEYPSKRTPQEKEGAMKLIGHLAEEIIDSAQYKSQMEGLFLRYIMPEFTSPHGFLRSRACQIAETCEKYDMDWQDPKNVNVLFDAIMARMSDPALPVRVQAASALPELVRYDSLRSKVAPNISSIMQDLLKLSNEVDLEVMTETGRKLVEDFSEELMPFAEALTSQLVLSFRRIIQELVELRDNDQDENSTDEKTFAAMGLLKTMNQLITSLESSKDILARLEAIVLPALADALQHEFIELYDDVFEIIDAITFHRRTIGPDMWRIFELIHRTFKSDGPDYFDTMIASLDNFISFGGSVFATQPELFDRLIDIYETAMTSAQLGATDRVQACKLAESVMLNMPGQADRVIPVFLNRSLEIVSRKNVSDEPVITSSLALHALESIINSLLYNPQLTIAFLDSRAATAFFFNRWHTKADRFSRVHDCKLGIMAIAAVFTSLDRLPDAVKEAAPSLLQISLRLFAMLPKALQTRRKLEEEYHSNEDMADMAEEEEDSDQATEKANSDVDDDQDFTEKERDYSGILSTKVKEKIKKATNDDEDSDDWSDYDEDWSEEVLFESPLDRLDVYIEFAKILQNLQAQQPVFFQRVTEKLQPGEMRGCGQIASIATQGGEKVVKGGQARLNDN